jgi:hypothetical protein
MTDRQPLIDRLEALVDRNNRPDWEDVVRRAEAPGKAARPARRSRRSYLARRLVPVFVLAAAALVIALIAPWDHGRSFTGSAVAERALVAIGSGPVLHVVLRQETESSYIDLASGQERPATAIEEIWYDSERHFEHIKYSSELGPPDSNGDEILQTPTGTWASYNIDPGPHTPTIDPALSEFFDGYRSALENGDAHVTGRGTIDGHDVTWIEFAVKLGCNHTYQACTERVAIDEASSLPLEIERLRKGKVASTVEIASIETLPAGSGDFSKPKKLPSLAYQLAHGQVTSITPSEAVAVLPGAVWAGKSISTFQLSSVSRATLTTRTFLMPSEHESSMSAEISIELHYGNGSPAVLWWDPATNEFPSGSNVVLQEAAKPDMSFWHDKTPPAGSMLTDNGGDGWLVKNGIYVYIHATSRELLLEAARALEPIPRS